jgi:hypothetical protein
VTSQVPKVHIIFNTNYCANVQPTVSGNPTDINVTKNTESNIDISSTTFSDITQGNVSDNITVTLTASGGVFSTPADGSGVGSGVTETKVSDTVITLAGTATDINTYLDTASNIKYTPPTDSVGEDEESITISVDDGNSGGNLASNPTINIDISALPSVSITAVVSAGTTDTATKITYTVRSGNSLKYLLGSSSASTPTYGDAISNITGATSYTSGADITGATAGKYLALYEIDGSNNIVGFYQKELATADIYTANTNNDTNNTNTNTDTNTTGIAKYIGAIPDQLVDINNTSNFELNSTDYFENISRYSFTEVKGNNSISDWISLDATSGTFGVKSGFDDNSTLLNPGKYYIQVFGYDSSDNNVSGYFTIRVKDLEAGLLEYITKPSGITTTDTTGVYDNKTYSESNTTINSVNISARVYSDGSSKHILAGIAEAESKLPDSKVEVKDNGDINTTTSTINSDGEVIDIEVLAKANDADGIKAEHSILLEDGNKTKAISKVGNTITTIRADRVVETNATVNSNHISVLAKPDGKAQHSVTVGSSESKVLVNFPGATTTITSTGVDTEVTYGGKQYLISTDDVGKSIPKKDGVALIDVINGDKLPTGSIVSVQDDGTIDINTTLTSDGLIIIGEGN